MYRYGWRISVDRILFVMYDFTEIETNCKARISQKEENEQMGFLSGGLELIGGLAMFLFGMSLMGEGLERRAGQKLKQILERMTAGRLRGLLLGIGVTAAIQSSSAVTVMVVGFVNSGIMSLHQSIGVIMGANIGTTVTAWLLSLTGVEGNTPILQLLKPTSFVPILALLGVWFCWALLS